MSTVIAATLGPACREQGVLEAMIRAGAQCFRLNFSQDSLEGFTRSVATLHQAAQAVDMPVKIMGDLCGPRFRIGPLESSLVAIDTGATLRIIPGDVPGTAQAVGTNYDHFQDDVCPGDRVLIDEARIQLQVQAKDDQGVTCTVIRGGDLSAGKGINLPDTRISVPPLTDQDRACIVWAIETNIDMLLMSFVHQASDLDLLRGALGGAELEIVAKIETLQATAHLEAIISRSDRVLIARGDLGVECGLARVPALQQQIVQGAAQAGKPTILATHLLHHMTTSPMPTRAEVSDVALALQQGIDMLLLTGETAVGQHPVEVVETLSQLCREIC